MIASLNEELRNKELQIEFLTTFVTILKNRTSINKAIAEYAGGDLVFSETGALSAKSKGYGKVAQNEEYQTRWDFYKTHLGLEKSAATFGKWMTLQEEITFYAVFQAAKRNLEENHTEIDWHDQIAKTALFSHLSETIKNAMKKEKNKLMLTYGKNPEVSTIFIDTCQAEIAAMKKAVQEKMPPLQKATLELMQAIRKLEIDYQLLGRSRHKKDIAKLIQDANRIFSRTPNITDQQKYDQLLKIVEDAFGKQQKHFCKPFLWIGKAKSLSAFTTAIREDQKNHHYSRLLAGIISKAYENDFSFGSSGSNRMQILANQCLQNLKSKDFVKPVNKMSRNG